MVVLDTFVCFVGSAKLLSKRIENASLASFFGQLWGGVHDPVDLKRTFARGKRPSATQYLNPSFIPPVSQATFFVQMRLPEHEKRLVKILNLMFGAKG